MSQNINALLRTAKAYYLLILNVPSGLVHRKKEVVTQTNVKFSSDSPMEEGKKVPC